MTKGVKICIAAITAVFIGAVIATAIIFRHSESEYVEIIQDNQIIYTIDIANSENRTFRIKIDGGGWNDVTIEDGKIYISDADCPDQTCIKTGVLRSESVPIVCLPHKLVIRFSDKNGE